MSLFIRFIHREGKHRGILRIRGSHSQIGIDPQGCLAGSNPIRALFALTRRLGTIQIRVGELPIKLDGELLPTGSRHTIRNGQNAEAGGYSLTFLETGSMAEVLALSQAALAEIAAIAEEARALHSVHFGIAHLESSLPIPAGIKVGIGAGCDNAALIRFDGVAERHCSLFFDGKDYFLQAYAETTHEKRPIAGIERFQAPFSFSLEPAGVVLSVR